MSDRLKDKVAVVTGSGRGLGKAFVTLMAAEGAKVVVNDLGGAIDGTGKANAPADETVAEIKAKGGIAVANYDSVATSEGAKNLIKTAVDNFGRIDILVNNAGITRDKMVFNMSDEDWDIVLKVHLYGHFYCTREACIHMREQKWGRIINLSSVGGGGSAPLGNPGQANYTAAKAGIIGLTKTIALEMGRYGVTSNVIFPAGATRLGWTPELKAAWEKRKAAGVLDATTSVLEKMDKGEITPEDVAPMIVYLATDAASNINGCAFHVMGKSIRLYGTMDPIKTIYSSAKWTVDELMELMPATIGGELVNPAPPKQ